jgi:hypothetical protein
LNNVNNININEKLSKIDESIDNDPTNKANPEYIKSAKFDSCHLLLAMK